MRETKNNQQLYHDGGVKTQSGQETSALQGNVRGSNAQSFARRIRQGENVVWGDAKLFGARDVRVFRAAARGEQNVLSSDDGLLLSLIRSLHILRINE